MLCDYFHPQSESPSMRAFMAAFRRKYGDLTPQRVDEILDRYR
mgnify:CR=1 FL=1